MYFPKGYSSNGITLPPYVMGIVQNGLVEVVDRNGAKYQIPAGKKEMIVYPYPPVRMSFNQRQLRWAEVVPVGTDILTAIANARSLLKGLPLPGDILDVQRSNPGWQEWLKRYEVSYDPSSMMVTGCGFAFMPVKERIILRMEDIGSSLVIGGDKGMLHLCIADPTAYNGAAIPCYCGKSITHIQQTAAVKDTSTVLQGLAASKQKVCKRCLKSIPTALLN
jgi:hypothetical protein